MRSPLLLYGISWACVRFSNFGKTWDLLTVSIVAAAALIAGILLWDFIQSLLSNGKQGILYTAVMIMGGITFIADEFFGVGWYLDTGNKEVDMFIGWGLLAVVSLFIAYVTYLVVTGHREEEEDME